MGHRFIAALLSAWLIQAQTVSVPLDPSVLQLKNVKAESTTYQGKKAVRITDIASADTPDGARFALIPSTDFQNGLIEVDLTGDTLPESDATFRGFTGIAFRATPDGSKYESFYLRPKNGRSQDQLQRNHSAQYMSVPDYPWPRLRQETPGKYESYVDLVSGTWTRVKIEVLGETARLFVNGSDQPTLIVSDLKHGQSKGLIGLWVGPRTLAYFSNLRITRR